MVEFTDETIQAELAVCEAATEGPLVALETSYDAIIVQCPKRFTIARFLGHNPLGDSRAMVHARTGYPAALKELLRLRETVDKHMPDMLDELNKAGKEIDVLKRKLAVAEEALGELQRLRQLLATVLPEHFVCPDCGPFVAADDDGCCIHCGADCEPGDTRKDLEAE